MSDVESIVDIWANDEDWNRLEAAILLAINIGLQREQQLLAYLPSYLYNSWADVSAVLRHLIATGVIQQLDDEQYVRRTDGWKPPNIVDDVNEKTMLGDTLLERQLNAFLTRRFILPSGVPSDECLSEARDIIKLVREHCDSRCRDQ